MQSVTARVAGHDQPFNVHACNILDVACHVQKTDTFEKGDPLGGSLACATAQFRNNRRTGY